ncbi:MULTISPECIES: hypothetical protein [Salipiger]|jgi:hypothetical protein|uniref:Holin n=1 Tax=Salipiger profundus TaxID=1229727 RepID=A0A1U7D4V3_9RHOB|nr:MULTISPECIES: hypothetical protein [Salipiger]APX23207.1 hypothetical protein Ga0080559_TMP2411 [Salipiger profundus]GGA14040.1 hypothetical protein GCM10011326_27740 [Salipiger profundus]SFD50737.1 hypothetical protein SAMN05444415_111194 [Salipiger profundus]
METKSIFASKGIWGGIIAILPPAMSLVGLDLSPQDAQGIVGHLDAIVSAVGGLVAIYGRVTAKTALRV